MSNQNGGIIWSTISWWLTILQNLNEIRWAVSEELRSQNQLWRMYKKNQQSPITRVKFVEWKWWYNMINNIWWLTILKNLNEIRWAVSEELRPQNQLWCKDIQIRQIFLLLLLWSAFWFNINKEAKCVDWDWELLFKKDFIKQDVFVKHWCHWRQYQCHWSKGQFFGTDKMSCHKDYTCDSSKVMNKIIKFSKCRSNVKVNVMRSKFLYQRKGIVKRNTQSCEIWKLTVQKLWARLKFSKCRSKVKRSNILVLTKRSCHKKYTCEIWKPQLLRFKSYDQD